MSVYIIAEAGVNHNGDIELARRLIDMAADAKADAIKFQSFNAGSVVTQAAPKAQYQIDSTGSAQAQIELLRKLELDHQDQRELCEYASTRNIDFLSSPFDSSSLHLLSTELGLKTIKIASGEITNAPLMLDIARNAERIILSTGMSSLADVEHALGVLAFGFVGKISDQPGERSFEQAYASQEGRVALRERVSLLHCTTEYPAPVADVNLSAMRTLSDSFGLPVGYSDHTQGIHISLAAVALGAVVIEKHFTLDRSMEGPDHQASLEPLELARMVREIRDIEAALGDGCKRPADSEWKNRLIARRSLVAATPVRAGEVFTEQNLQSKRPGTGVSPFRYWQVIGRAAGRDYSADELIDDQ